MGLISMGVWVVGIDIVFRVEEYLGGRRVEGTNDVHGFVFFAFFKIPFEKEEAESCFELIFYAKEFEIFGPDLSITLFYSC